MGTKQTAVDYLIDNLHYINSTKWNDIIDQAKQMEKEQIMDAYNDGIENEISIYSTIDSEQYYETTYGKD